MIVMIYRFGNFGTREADKCKRRRRLPPSEAGLSGSKPHRSFNGALCRCVRCDTDGRSRAHSTLGGALIELVISERFSVRNDSKTRIFVPTALPAPSIVDTVHMPHQ